MRRTFNYTGRRNLPLHLIHIRVQRDERGEKYFDATLALADLQLPGDAAVFVEAFFERAYCRFDFGTVSRPVIPANRSLAEIDYGGRIQFRVKVVDTSTAQGRLVAVADDIVPLDATEGVGDRESLLPVLPRHDLGDEVWRVSFDATGPSLEVNSGIDDVMSLFKNNRVIASIVYPQVLRTILTSAILINNGDGTENTWEAKWIKFGELLSSPVPDLTRGARDEDEVLEWISSAAREFSTRLRARDHVNEALREEKL